MAARYLLRFDDICPTMNWRVWEQVESILTEAKVQPLLAVVPDNQDPHLAVDPSEPRFWERVCEWQSRGWSIGLHGFEHRYVTQAPGIVGRNRYSEFAGLPSDDQRRKLEAGLEIFRLRNVTADAWVAPAHSFDDTTVELLAELGVGVISDGYALQPYLCRRGVLWVPQQLGRFRAMPFGLWTVCLHINEWGDAEVRQFAADVSRFRPSMATLSGIRKEFEGRSRAWSDDLFQTFFRAARSLRA